jgi:hypothetical protein
MVDRDSVLAKIRRENPDLAKALADHPEIAAAEIAVRKEFYPTKDFVPNIAQERALAAYRTKHESYKDFPFGTIFTGGNGVGKTADLAVFLAGMTLGKEFLHPEYFGNHEYFDWCQKVRRERRLKIRIVCDAVDMEENGSVYQEIHRWVPVARFEDKLGKYYSTVIIPAPSKDFHPTYIDVKTHNQDIVAHAGPTYDMILFNEPCPEKLWSENMARLRRGGRYATFLTPLHMAAYLHNVITGNRIDGKIAHVQASIWENCRDIPGTRGILARSDIETQIASWEQVNPLEVPARRDGKFMYLAGAVFQIYSHEHHVISPENTRSEWNIYQVVDPHPHKPHVALWVAVCPLGLFRVIAEYPTEDWTQLTGTTLTLKDFCKEYRLVESGKHPKFPYIQHARVQERFGDPNGMKAEHPYNRATIQAEYSWAGGLDYNTNVDNDIALRHNRIRELLQFDPARRVEGMNTPHLYVYSTCWNMRRALGEYRYATKQGSGAGLSDKLDPTWKCWIDALGYLLVSVSGWEAGGSGPEGNDDYYAYLEGMRPGIGNRNYDDDDDYNRDDISILSRY